jgi:Fe-S oxidoreductase
LKATKNSDVCIEGVVEEPRDILKKIPGVDFVEMRWNREKSFCCGGDVATRLTYPQVSAEIGKKAIDEAVKVEADYLVTSCPACNRQFIDVLDSSEGKQKIEVLSLCEIVANSIE